MSDHLQFLATLAPWPQIDLTELVEVKQQPKLQQFTASFLGRNWVVIPHVAHYDEAAITVFENRRKAWDDANPDCRPTAGPVLDKLVANALAAFPLHPKRMGTWNSASCSPSRSASITQSSTAVRPPTLSISSPTGSKLTTTSPRNRQ